MRDPVPLVFKGGALSNFAFSPLRLPGPDGVDREYPTVEHFFQASKARDVKAHDAVAAASSPRAAKRAGQRVSLRDDWETVKRSVMLAALFAKFSQEPFRSTLLSTGTRPIVEENAGDLEWGARRNVSGWEGRNQLGELLMRVRAELSSVSPDADDPQLSLFWP